MVSSNNKKKLAFYSIMSSGHLNVCVSLSKVLLDNYGDKIEIYFIVDNVWQKKLKQMDERLKYGIIEYDNKETESRMDVIIEKMEVVLEMNPLDKLNAVWKFFTMDPTMIEVDTKAEQLLREIRPDFVLADQAWNLPALLNTGIPYGFVISLNPLVVTAKDLPRLGSGIKVNDLEKMKEFEEQFEPCKKEMENYLHTLFEKRGSKFNRKDIEIDQLKSDHFSIYSYPLELCYFNDQIRMENKLWQIDSALFPSKIPLPYKLPEEFEKLPGKIIYVSLGSLFSMYTSKLQKLVDILDNLPYKYIFSKGPNGEKLKFPNDKFIGENYIDQLAVLQVADAMIAHGGNNTLCECFFFGIPCLVVGLIGDQISNAVRIEEMNYGYQMNILELNEKEVSEKLDKILNDKDLKTRIKKASQRIQKENKIVKVCDQIMEYLENKL